MLKSNVILVVLALTLSTQASATGGKAKRKVVVENPIKISININDVSYTGGKAKRKFA